jgi:hypothetical protein
MCCDRYWSCALFVQQELMFHNDDGSCQLVVVERNLRARDLCHLLALKNRVAKDVSWTIVEQWVDLGLGEWCPSGCWGPQYGISVNYECGHNNSATWCRMIIDLRILLCNSCYGNMAVALDLMDVSTESLELSTGNSVQNRIINMCLYSYSV